MAPLEDPPTASSSSDDDEISSGEDQISNSSTEIPTTETLKSPEKTTTSAKSKKNEVHSSSKKKRASEVTPAEDMHVKRSKNNKKSGEDNKKQLNPPRFLWSEEDEIYVLQGMIDFKAETGKNPYDDMNEFYDITKKFISFDVSKLQFTEKIRSLKRKYIIGKDKKVNESSFSKPHDMKCLGLAMYIWRSDAMAPEAAVVKSPLKSNAVKSPVKSKKKPDLEEVENVDQEVVESDVVAMANGNEKKVEEEVVIVGGDAESSNWFDKSFLVQSCASLGANESCVKEKWSKVPIETKNRIKEKLKLVEAKEYELLTQKTDILKEVIFVMSEAI